MFRRPIFRHCQQNSPNSWSGFVSSLHLEFLLPSDQSRTNSRRFYSTADGGGSSGGGNENKNDVHCEEGEGKLKKKTASTSSSPKQENNNGKDHSVVGDDEAKQPQQRHVDVLPSESIQSFLQKTKVMKKSSPQVSSTSTSDDRTTTSTETGNDAAKSTSGVSSTTSCKIKVKRKGPWGKLQLRDSWSIDAMTRHDKDSVGERIKREYRYHPDEPIRQSIKWMGFSMLLATPFTAVFLYYVMYEDWIWHGDWQHILNLFRQVDTSPRSKLYYYRDPLLEELKPKTLRRTPEMESVECWRKELAPNLNL